MKLYKHQKEALDRGKQDNLALFHEPGCGKTLVALELIRYYGGPALVVCPLSIIDAAWITDCEKFTPQLSITSLWSKKPSERLERLNSEHDIYVCNYEILKSLYSHIVQKGFNIIIIDESSKMKNPKSQITRCLLSFAGIRFRGSPFKTDKLIPHRYVLSGTPAPNDESEYWGQISFVAPGEVFSKNFYAFRGKYFHSIPLGLTGQNMFRFRESMHVEFMDTIKPSAHIVQKEYALDLPEQVHVIRNVHLSPCEQGAYDTLKKDYVLRFGDEEVLARTMLTEIMKLRQLTSGFAYGDEGTYSTGHSKLDELKTLLEEIGDHQVIIWANFREEILQLFDSLENSNALFGETHRRVDVIKNFQDGKTKYLIANPMSGGHGLTFVNCRYAVYYSLNYSYELQKQSQDRIHRIGQTKKCTYFYLLAKNTIDESIYKVLQNKHGLSQTILSYLRTDKKSHGHKRIAVTS